MSLVQARCTRCGAVQEADSEKDAAICTACGDAYVVKKAIGLYNAGIIDGASDFVILDGTLKKYVGSAKRVVIPDGVSVIGESAFEGNGCLNEIEIPDSVTEIKTAAFYECTNLQWIKIPDSVREIGYGAFEYCTRLETLQLPKSITEISGKMFYGCSALCNIAIPKGVTTIEAYAFQGCSNLGSIGIPDSIETINGTAFSQCDSLRYVSASEDWKRKHCGEINGLVEPKSEVAEREAHRETLKEIREALFDRFGGRWR